MTIASSPVTLIVAPKLLKIQTYPVKVQGLSYKMEVDFLINTNMSIYLFALL